MEIIHSFLLGLLQGLTEFLPVSSSGHLALAEAILGDTAFSKNILFTVVVHFGTLCSIVVYYREKLAEIIISLWGLLLHPGEFSERAERDGNIKLSGLILISMIPALIVGLTLKDQIEALARDPFLVSIMLVVTGVILYSTKFRRELSKHVNAPRSFVIGLAQAFAIIPGISRSGSTISTGLHLGIEREEVANFSFLMVIPVIAGAMLLEVKDVIETGINGIHTLALVIGFFTAFISGYFALKYLIIFLRTRGIHPFAWYCWVIGLAGLIYFC